MQALVVLLAFVLLAVVLVVIGAPLRASLERSSAGGEEPNEPVSPERAELEAERETKYREIRDAELDFRTGKLSPEDYAALDATLRGEALEILDRLQALDGRRPGDSPGERPGERAGRAKSTGEWEQSNPEIEG